MDGFDVAIVGAGSAGCALAGRLSARTDLRIALIEAGPDYGPRASGAWPADLLDAHHSPDSHQWGYEQARARVISGCSAHNECALVRALPGAQRVRAGAGAARRLRPLEGCRLDRRRPGAAGRPGRARGANARLR